MIQNIIGRMRTFTGKKKKKKPTKPEKKKKKKKKILHFFQKRFSYISGNGTF